MNKPHFTPSDIKVGKHYRNKDFPNCIWLGVGKRKPFTEGNSIEFAEKHLVLVASPVPEHLGLMFKSVDDDFGAWQSDWDLFEEI
jgi:hypothetical protein